MASFSDLLKGVTGRLGFNHEDPERSDNNVDWKLSFSAKPKKNIDLNMEKKVENVSKDGVSSQNEKTASKLKINHGGCTTTYGFANDKMSFEACGQAYDADGWKVKIGNASEVKQAKNEWKSTGNLNIKGDDLGGAKVAIDASAEYNQAGAITVKPKINIEVADEINVGVSAKHDSKAFTEIWPQLVYKPKGEDGFYWVRLDMTRNWLMAGCNQSLKAGIEHSFEALYGWKEFKGIRGQPFMLRGGVEYDLSDKTSVSASGEWSESYNVQQEVTHNVDDHWTVSCTQSFDASELGGKGSPYHIGFAASYKL